MLSTGFYGGHGTARIQLCFCCRTNKLGVIIKYAVPLIVLILAGTVLIFIITFYFGRKLSRTFWFERTIFAWGWWTGTMAMDDYAMAYLPIAPIEILLITFVSILFVNGFGVWFSLVCISLSALILLLAWKMGWWIKTNKRQIPPIRFSSCLQDSH